MKINVSFVSSFCPLWFLLTEATTILTQGAAGTTQRQLEEYGINVAGILSPKLEGKDTIDDDKIMANVPLYLETQTKTINSYFRVTKKDNLQPTKELNIIKAPVLNELIDDIFENVSINERHFELIIGGLQKEIARLSRKEASVFPDSGSLVMRKDTIEATMQTLQAEYGDKTLNYGKLHEELAALQNKMWHTNFLKKNLANFFKLEHNTQGAQNIRELAHKIPYCHR